MLKRCFFRETAKPTFRRGMPTRNPSLGLTQHTYNQFQAGCYLTYRLDSKLSKNIKKWHIAMVTSIKYALSIVRYALGILAPRRAPLSRYKDL